MVNEKYGMRSYWWIDLDKMLNNEIKVCDMEERFVSGSKLKEQSVFSKIRILDLFDRQVTYTQIEYKYKTRIQNWQIPHARGLDEARSMIRNSCNQS